MSIRLTTLLLCLCLVLLPSCAFNQNAPPSYGGSVSADVALGATVITFAAPPAQHDRYQPLITAFHHDHPDLRVQLVPAAPGTPLAELVTAADTAVIETDNLPGLEPGYLFDLTPLASSDAAFQPDAFFPLAASLLLQDEQRYALPLWLEVPTFSYNQDLWAATGLPLPSADWQWADLIAAADQIAQTGPDDPVVYGLQDDATGILALIGMLADAEVDLLGRNGPPDLTSPAATAVYAQFFALTARGSIHTPAHEAALPDGAASDPAARIRAGQVGVWASSLLRGADAENLPFTSGTLPMPPLPVF
ncbi:MAG: extracellular solute-binding protein, partial [Chloroflexales bacterium]|nr:extracellular solute-binding protein [Chloroflexales bacterium]